MHRMAFPHVGRWCYRPLRAASHGVALRSPGAALLLGESSRASARRGRAPLSWGVGPRQLRSDATAEPAWEHTDVGSGQPSHLRCRIAHMAVGMRTAAPLKHSCKAAPGSNHAGPPRAGAGDCAGMPALLGVLWSPCLPEPLLGDRSGGREGEAQGRPAWQGDQAVFIMHLGPRFAGPCMLPFLVLGHTAYQLLDERHAACLARPLSSGRPREPGTPSIAAAGSRGCPPAAEATGLRP